MNLRRVWPLLLVVSATLRIFPQTRSMIPLYFHDRDSLSFLALASVPVEKIRIVLIDAHHDLGPGPDSAALKDLMSLPLSERRSEALRALEEADVRSYNWAGAALLSGIAVGVIWVPKPELPRSRMPSLSAWIDRSLSRETTGDRGFVKQRVRMVGLKEFLSVSPPPAVVSIDLDFFSGMAAGQWKSLMGQIHDFLKKHPPRMITFALSAAYQKDASAAWEMLAYAVSLFSDIADEVFQARFSPSTAESNEEARAWNAWSSLSGQAAGHRFAPGLALWENAPEAFKAACIAANVRPDDPWAAALLESWAGR